MVINWRKSASLRGREQIIADDKTMAAHQNPEWNRIQSAREQISIEQYYNLISIPSSTISIEMQ